MLQSQIQKETFNGNLKGKDLNQLLDSLGRAKLITGTREPTGKSGRIPIRWRLAKSGESV